MNGRSRTAGRKFGKFGKFGSEVDPRFGMVSARELREADLFWAALTGQPVRRRVRASAPAWSRAGSLSAAPRGEGGGGGFGFGEDVPGPSGGGGGGSGTRLRMSLFDFNASFLAGLTFSQGTATGCKLDTSLLDAFKAARLDDYSLVNTIGFGGASASNDPNKPVWKDFAPGGSSGEALRVDYLTKLTSEMHSRGAQVIAGYVMGERGTTISTAGTAFRNWLAGATAAQVTQHARDIADFFASRHIPIDGVGFDIELNGFGAAQAPNTAVLLSETAKAMAAARPGALVYYDTAPFQPQDGQGAIATMSPLKYAVAAGAPNLIARPMCYNGTVTPTTTLASSIACALRSGANGGGLTASHLQMAIDVARTPDATVRSQCTSLFRPNNVGMTIYTMPGGAAAQKAFLGRAAAWESALNPGAPPPGTSGQPLQVPVP